MAERYDLVSPRERKNSEKPFWHKVGAAFKNEKGGYSLVFDSLPLPDKDGSVRLMMWAAKEKTENKEQAAPAEYPDDSIPF